MNPVGIIRHARTEGAGYFVTFLERQRLPWRVIKLDEGDAVPADAGTFSGLSFMGGPMSVNDDLPWIAPVLALIRDAVAKDIPVIGHCLGGQLLAKALGGVVTRNSVKEIGWGRVDVLPGADSRRWLGDAASFESFHWHGETFSPPPGAVRLAKSAHCANQMFALGKHLGMQCHVEMTQEMIETWCMDWHSEVRALSERVASVQTPDEMLAHVTEKVLQLHATADRIYSAWIAGLVR
jgi:GMP synthase-like glutamine amidotransferase